MSVYLAPTQSAGRALIERAPQGAVVMLNLLRFRAIADYEATPELAPEVPIPGAQAYALYVAHTLPHLRASGGEILFDGTGGPWLIGPGGERWDRALIIRQSSLAAFLAHAQNLACMAGLGHRTAAIEDSRLLPLTPYGAA